jgi:hypothetical protein
LVLFLPGYFLLLAIFGKKKIFSGIEKLVIAVVFSIISVDFLMMILNRLDISITRASLLAAILVFAVICFAIYKLVKRQSDFEAEAETNKLFNFSKKQTALIIAILFLTIFIKVAYLADNILPQATDLGHHMYWAKEIAVSGHIPEYAQRDIQQINGVYQIGPLQNISDFIIGEHLIFSAVAILSGLDFISYFPVVTLFLINLASILAIFILALRFFKNHSQAKNIAILALFFIGPLFAISPPEAKYVAGGVIGNILGNLLLPVSFYFFYRALTEKNRAHAMAAFFSTMGLFYTHHLTGFILIFILALSVVLLLIFNFRQARSMLGQWAKLFFSWPVIIFLIFALVFVLGVYTPSYLKNTAVNTVIGGPSKAGHEGLIFSQFKFTIGEPREVLGLVGAGLALLLLYKRKDENDSGYQAIFMISWILVILLISLYPQWIKIDVPSSRIGNYGSFPFSILASLAIIEIIGIAKSKAKSPEGASQLFLSSKMLLVVMVLIFSYAVAQGFYDNKQNQIKNADAQKTVQTFAASRYLAQKTDGSDQIVKDHVFMTADAWVKLFFMRDYNFPFYRANFDRYANGIDKKESCTLWMISTPSSPDSQKCYQDLGINFAMINKTDAPQFEKDNNFWQVYNNGEIRNFYRSQSE